MDSHTSVILERLNAYAGGNIWQDVILCLDAYDDAATEILDHLWRSDVFALTDGRVLRADAQTGAWFLAEERAPISGAAT